MKINWKKLIISLAVPLAVGGLSAWLSGGAMERFDSLQKPALAPPSWLFPVVWTILFLMMGVASYLVAEGKADEKQKKTALIVYGVQLAFNLRGRSYSLMRARIFSLLYGLSFCGC